MLKNSKKWMLFLLLLPAASSAEPLRFTGLDLGAVSTVTYNSAWSQTTSTDFRLGFGIGTKADFSFAQHRISVALNLTKSQLLTQKIDGSENDKICTEGYGKALFALPGACSMIQVRLSPLYWFRDFGFGISFVYNYFSDYTFKGEEIYNSKRSYQALGPVVAYQKKFRKFTFMATLHFDYAVLSQSALVANSVQSLQAGVTLYAMYAIF